MIYIRIRNKQPICVAADQAQGTIRRSLDYIPGSALRGALAAQLRTAQPTISQKEFDWTMLGARAQFQNLYPLPGGREVSLPLPKTTQSCKLYPGFEEPPPAAFEPPRHGTWDQLFAFLRYQLADEVDRGNHIPTPYCRADGCKLPAEPFGGFYGGIQAGDYVVSSLSRRQITQTAIDGNRETARPANLFTVEALEENHAFAGYFALGNGGKEDEFCQTVCPKGTMLRIGYGRTRGFGLAEVTECRVSDPLYWPEDLATRVSHFNSTARSQQCTIPGQTLFALTLMADAIVLDPFFRHQTSLDGGVLGREVHRELARAKLLLAVADTRLVSGWSSPHGLPLPEEQAIRAGSVFVFKSERPEEELISIFEESALERYGLGERTAEGFGQVVVCHPFHQEVDPV